MKPRYQQIIDFIRSGINDRHFAVGSKIPAEVALAERFGVSRMTVNKAIRDLVAEGLLERFAGDGTYVKDHRAESPLLELRNIAEEVRGRGHRYSSRMLGLQRVAASEAVAHQLGLKPGAWVFHSVIIHCEDSVPIQLEDRYVNPQAVPEYLEQDFSRLTPHEYLMQVCPLSEFEHVVEAVLPDLGAAQLLDISTTEPCIQVSRRTWSAGMLVSCARLLHPGSRYKLKSVTRPWA